MNQPASQKTMSGLDKFGLISGIIGLTADVLALAAVFQTQQQQPQGVSVNVWLLIFLLSIYAILIISFYFRKASAEKARREVTSAHIREYQRVEKGARRLTKGIGTPLFTVYFYMLIFSHISIPAGEKKEIAEAGLAIFSLIVAYNLSSLIDWVAHFAYRGFDVNYKLDLTD